jgi:uncharacterized iron-regulated membrane protein
MAWLHTWCGVVVGSLLFVIFWMGSLSVFDKEIDRWMRPETRLASAATVNSPVKLDGALTEAAQHLAKNSPHWFVRLPSERKAVIELNWRGKGEANEQRNFAPATGQMLPHTNTLAGSGFIFPFHFRLHLKWMDVGYWLVGFAGMAMLLMLVSGVVIHRKILVDFFLFRPQKHMQRASLDLHNLTGVLALPFHFVITLSGLIIFFAIYFPTSYLAAYPQEKDARQAFNTEAYGQYRRPAAKAPGTLASLEAMVAQAEQGWQGGRANFVRVWHPGDANSYVEIRRGIEDRVTMSVTLAYFDAGTGQLIQRFEGAPLVTAQRFITGLHFIQFDHWTLRWLYFVAGLSGCLMIATGFMFWLESRRASHARKGLTGVRMVEALTTFSVTGTLLATLAFFIANRLLPANASLAGFDRAALEMGAFYLVWLLTLGHAARRQRAAWAEQSSAIAVAAVLAVVLNSITTGDHPLYSLQTRQWAVLGMDMLLLLSAGLAAWAARRLHRKPLMRAATRPFTPPTQKVQVTLNA